MFSFYLKSEIGEIERLVKRGPKVFFARVFWICSPIAPKCPILYWIQILQAFCFISNALRRLMLKCCLAKFKFTKRMFQPKY